MEKASQQSEVLGMNFDDEQAMRVRARRLADEYVQAIADADVVIQGAIEIDEGEVTAIMSPGFREGVARAFKADGDDDLKLASIVALVLARRKMLAATAAILADVFPIDAGMDTIDARVRASSRAVSVP